MYRVLLLIAIGVVLALVGVFRVRPRDLDPALFQSIASARFFRGRAMATSHPFGTSVRLPARQRRLLPSAR